MPEKGKRDVRRPTEERALSAIAREAARLGITQFELLTRNLRKRQGSTHNVVCTCLYCQRRRQKVVSHRVVLSFT